MVLVPTVGVVVWVKKGEKWMVILGERGCKGDGDWDVGRGCLSGNERGRLVGIVRGSGLIVHSPTYRGLPQGGLAKGVAVGDRASTAGRQIC